MGSIAKRHLVNLRQLHPDAQIYAVSSSGNNAELPNGADSIVSLDKLISYQPDYVIVASPAPYHVNTAQQLLAQGIAVLVEKPLADNADSCKQLQTYCDNHITEAVAVGYCLRFLPSATVVKDYLSKGLLGTIYNVEANIGQYLPNWRSDKNYKDSVSARKELGGGALLELSHELDYLYWLLGDLTLQHSWLRTTDELGLDVEEIANLVLTSENNIYVTVHLDFIQKSVQRTCEFIGEKGRLVWDLLTNSVNIYHAAGKDTLYSEPEYNKNNMYIDMLTAFEGMARGAVTNLATIGSATKVVQLIDEAKKMNKWSHQN